jgi:hypothetical protein
MCRDNRSGVVEKTHFARHQIAKKVKMYSFRAIAPMLTFSGPRLRGLLRLSALVAFPLCIWLAACRWQTESIGGLDFVGASTASPADAVPGPSAARADNAVASSEDRWEGVPAKRRVLELLDQALARLERAPGYTVKFRMRERIKGVLGPEQRLEMKLRHSPFAVYLRSLEPHAGREAIYAEGRNNDKLVVHQVDWTRHLTPRLVLAPTSGLVLAYSRHPITEAGLANLSRSLRKTAELDLGDDGTKTVLDRVADSEGREWLHSIHKYARPGPERPFARVEVFYDLPTSLPLRMSGYDWPRPGVVSAPQLGEQHIFEDLNFEVTLSDQDFNPDNPSYDFKK